MSNGSSETTPPTKDSLMSRSGFSSPLLVILTALAIFFSSQLVAALLIQAALSFLGKDTTGIFDSAVAQFAFILVAEILAVWLVFWIVRRRGLKLSSIGLGRFPRWKDLGIGTVAFITFYLALALLFALLVAIFPEVKSKLDTPQEVGFDNLKSLTDKLFAFTALVILAPIGEEVLVRGYLYSGLRSHWRFLPAAVVTSLVFGAAHLQPENPGALVWGAALTTFIMSLMLVYLREKTGALYAGIAVHAFNNLVAFAVYFTAVSF